MVWPALRDLLIADGALSVLLHQLLQLGFAVYTPMLLADFGMAEKHVQYKLLCTLKPCIQIDSCDNGRHHIRQD